MNNFTYSQSGLHLTEQFEGDVLKSYQDTGGVWTIAYGHTGPDVVAGMTCTQLQAVAWLTQDIAWAEREVNKLVTIPLNQDEFDALVDFTFNCGCGNFDHSTLLAELNKGDLADAAKQFEVWCKCDGKVVAGLLRRRLAEEQLFNGGN